MSLEQIRRGAGPYHLDRDTPVLKIECVGGNGNGGGPAVGGYWLTDGGELIVTEVGIIITS